MPLTPFHPVPVWLLWMWRPNHFDFVALTVGSVIPDLLEPVFLFALPEWYMGHREWSHSVLGALTYDLAVALVATLFVARPLLGWLNRVRPSPLWTRFADQEFSRPVTRRVTLLSAAIGTLSHPLIDFPFHSTSQLLFPGPPIEVFPEAYAWIGGTASALIFGPAFFFMVYRYWLLPAGERPPRRLEASD